MIIAIIVAAGKSSRINEHIKKQYIIFNGFPLFCHSLKIFDTCKIIDEIYVVFPKSDLKICKTIITNSIKPIHKIHIVSGGTTRQASVSNALKIINRKKSIVLIHDGARPFITKNLILQSIYNVKNTGACIPVLPINDTIKKINKSNFIAFTIKRKKIWTAQTPQTFRLNLIKKAHQLAEKINFYGTDDSSIAEHAGAIVKTIHGNPYNIKITNKEDITLAYAIAQLTKRS